MIVLLTLAMLPVLLAQDQGKAETCSYLAGKISKLDDAITLSFCDLTGLDFAKLVIPSVCQTVSMTAIPPCMVKVGKAAQDQCMVDAVKFISQEYNAPEEEMTIVEQCKCNAFGKSRYNLMKVQEMLDCSSSAARKRRGASTQPEPVHHQPQPAYPHTQPAYPHAQPQPAYPHAQPQQAYYQPQQAFGADTLWFQYSLCQDKDFMCYFFSNHWSQGDFGQYYLYDNLLADGNGLFGGDNSLLPLLALSGGGGGSMNTILPLLLLNRERRGADCEAGSLENLTGDCVTCPDGTVLNAAKNECVNARKRRSTLLCPVGSTLNEAENECVARKRRATCPIGHINCVCPVGTTLNEAEEECVSRKRRSPCPRGHVNCVCPVGTTLSELEDECVDRKRRSTCPIGHVNCVCPFGTTLNEAEEECVSRKRRSPCPRGHVNCVCPVGTTLSELEDECVDRKRRSTCPIGHVNCMCPFGTTLNEAEDECVSRKRRSTCPMGHVNCVCPVGTALNATEDECVNARKRRAVGLVCDEGGTELDADLICDGSADCEDGADEAACN